MPSPRSSSGAAVAGQELLSVVVVIVSDTTARRADVADLATCLEALSRQVDAPPLEIIVPHRPDVDGIEGLRERFGDVVFLPVAAHPGPGGRGGGREHHDVLRARGVAAARGALVGLVEDHARPDPRWCANVVSAHREPYAAIGGAIENDIDRPLNWAVYYCDFGKYQNPLLRGESAFASDANVTYKRAALDAIRPVWAESFREVVVHRALASRGEKVALEPSIVVYQSRRRLRLAPALRERFVWGRSYAATRCAVLGGGARVLYAGLAPLLPVVLLLRMAALAWRRRRHFGRFLRALPLSVLLLTWWSIGEGVGYLTARPGGPEAPP